jgi:phosphate transport system substrate-binding protein
VTKSGEKNPVKKTFCSVVLVVMGVGMGMGSVSAVAAERDVISIVGSSTVYPFATVVAERFGRSTAFKTPKIESTGSGGGLKLFCQGVGVNTPDITNASRRIKSSEVELCASNGVNEIVEVKIGFDGIVLGNSKNAERMNLTRKDIFLALAKDVPNPDGSESLVANPYKTWKEVNASLPDTKIEVLGPPPTSGTRDAFAELALEGGCKSYDWIKAIKKQDKNRYKAICHAIREDGAYIEAGENDNLIVQKLQANAAALGVFGFSFLDQNEDKVQGSLVDGQSPEFEAIADGSYPISRALYFYVKKAHVGQIDGLEEYLAEFTNDRAWGDEGYLADKGLIPMPADARAQVAKDVKALKPLAL